MANPLVSILINNYNYAPFLAEAIDSALAQTYANVEVVVVDDGSKDNSREIIASYGDRIVPVIKENGGQASAFNAGFAASKGDFLCFLDSDDKFLPHKIEHLVKIFSENPDTGWIFDKVIEFDHKTGERCPPPADCALGAWDVRSVIASGVTPFIPTATSGLSFRRSLLDLMLPMPVSIRITSDLYLKLIALGLTKGWMTPEEITLQRIHGENLYTHLKKGRRYLKGYTALLTGLSIYERFPTLRRLGIVLFSRGLGLCFVATAPNTEYRKIAGSFLRELPLRTRTEILVRTLYSGSRQFLSKA